MEVTLTTNIIQEGEKSFTGWISEIKGVIAQGSSVDEVKKELFEVLKIKFDIERKKQRSLAYLVNTIPDDVITEKVNLIPA